MQHIEELEARMAKFDAKLLDGLEEERHMLQLLCECAHAASRTTSVFKSKYTSLAIRHGHKRAIIALAHKLLRTCFFMISRGDCYRDSAVDYEAMAVKRNAPRWIKALKAYGYPPAQT